MSPTFCDMFARRVGVAPILARWVCRADTELKMSWPKMSALGDIF